MRKWIQLWASSAALLCFACLPFPFTFIPQVGSFISGKLFPIHQKICSIFHLEVEHDYLTSDAWAYCTTAGIVVLITAIFSTIAVRKNTAKLVSLQRNIHYLLVVLLSYFLLRYGLDKLFGVQFYTPASNTLHTPVGHLSKDLLFWTTMGSSSGYNYFMAILEMMAGTLLLFHRTRFIALLASVGILLNILAINLGFDITVKYLSGLLVFTSVICTLNLHSDQLYFLATGKLSPFVLRPLTTSIVLVLFIPFGIDLYRSYSDVQPKKSGRSFNVLAHTNTSQFMDIHQLRRIHLHPDGYLIFENTTHRFESYSLNKPHTIVRIKQHFIPIQLKAQELVWIEAKDTIRLALEEIDLLKMELLQ